MLDNKFFADLIKDTEFKVAEKGSLMHSRSKIITPSHVLNCIWGGGIPLANLSEVSGGPGSGKSTFLYQCMGNYQRAYPNGISVILDMESSMDNDRLEALGVDTDKVLRLPATTLEQAFANLFKLLNKVVAGLETNKDLSLFVIYDSLASGGTDSEQKATQNGQSAFGAGTMREDTRALKHNLQNIVPYLEKLPLFIGFINQVMVKPNPYGGPAKVESGGGNSLKHLCHTHIVFGNNKDNYDGSFLKSSESKMELHKSKLSPKMINIPIEIDITQGGRIDETDSFVKYLADSSVGLIVTGSWYKFGEYLKKDMILKYPVLSKHTDLVNLLGQNIRKDDLYKLVSDDKDIFNFLQISLIEFLDGIYPAQRAINDEYQKKLIADCKYFSEP